LNCGGLVKELYIVQYRANRGKLRWRSLLFVRPLFRTHKAASSVSVIRPISVIFERPVTRHAMIVPWAKAITHRHGCPYLTTAQMSVSESTDQLRNQGRGDERKSKDSPPQFPRLSPVLNRYKSLTNPPQFKHVRAVLVCSFDLAYSEGLEINGDSSLASRDSGLISNFLSGGWPRSHILATATLTHLQSPLRQCFTPRPRTLLVQWVSVGSIREPTRFLMAAIPTERYASTALLAPEGPDFSIRKRAFQACIHADDHGPVEPGPRCVPGCVQRPRRAPARLAFREANMPGNENMRSQDENAG